MTQEQRTIRTLRKSLRDLTGAVTRATEALDRVMSGPSTTARGASVAKIVNYLDLNNQRALRFGLGTTKKIKHEQHNRSDVDSGKQSGVDSPPSNTT